MNSLPVDSITNLVTFKRVVKIDSTSATVLFELAKEWMSNTQRFNIEGELKGSGFWGKNNFATVDALYKITDVIKLADEKNKKLIGRFFYKYFGHSLGACINFLYINGTIKIYLKDNKYKIEASDMTYAHYSNKRAETGFGTLSDTGDCGSRNPIESMLKCANCKTEKKEFYITLWKKMNDLFDDFEKYVKTHKNRNTDF